MITYIRGILEGMEEDKVIVDVGGVGYGIYMAGTAMGRLPALGKEVKIHTCCECIDKRVHLPCSFEVQMQKPDSCSCKSACRTGKSRDPDHRADTQQKLTSKYKIGDYKYNRPFCLLYIIF